MWPDVTKSKDVWTYIDTKSKVICYYIDLNFSVCTIKVCPKSPLKKCSKL